MVMGIMLGADVHRWSSTVEVDGTHVVDGTPTVVSINTRRDGRFPMGSGEAPKRRVIPLSHSRNSMDRSIHRESAETGPYRIPGFDRKGTKLLG